MLISDDNISIISNVKWIDNIPSKPTLFILNNIAANINTKVYRKKRRLNKKI